MNTAIRSIIVFGATSAIVESLLRLYAVEGAQMLLIARNAEKLSPIAQDLTIRGAKKIDTHIADLAIIENHSALFKHCQAHIPYPDLILIAPGVLIPQSTLDRDIPAGMANFYINANAVISLLMHSAQWSESMIASLPSIARRIAVIGSVAGDVGRAKMTLYGAAKAAIDRVVSGLNGRFYGTSVRFINIKPGYINTPMTAGIRSRLMSSTADTAPMIKRAIASGCATAYIPRWWQIIMLILQHLPQRVLNRAKI